MPPQAGHSGEDLLPLVYDELRALAKRKMVREDVDITLQATALVHEAYLKLQGGAPVWDHERHYYAAAARAMRHILVDRARAKKTTKRGGSVEKVGMDVAIEQVPTDEPTLCGQIELLALDEALAKLADVDELQANLLELRFFAGLTTDEIAECLELTTGAVNKHFKFAKAWLLREIGDF